MNELIKKLAKQAFGPTIDTDPMLIYEAETFAELIVKECIDKVGGFFYENEVDCYMASDVLKKHFGLYR